MNSELAAAIQEIRGNRALVSIDEACTKAGVVLRLLSTLGWNPFNVEEVKPEFTLGAKRVDYSLRIANTNKVFFEVKRIGENLEPHQEQLLGYSFQQGVRLAVLTNGATWWFYLPLNEGAWASVLRQMKLLPKTSLLLHNFSYWGGALSQPP